MPRSSERQDAERFWNQSADTYDSLARHGIRTRQEQGAWTRLLEQVIEIPQGRVLDVGTGTGSLAVLAAKLGHEVVGVDYSSAMLGLTREKSLTSGAQLRLVMDDVTSLRSIRDSSFDVVLSRHLLWTLADPVETTTVWARKCRPGGILAAIDGCWSVQNLRQSFAQSVAHTIERLIHTSRREHGTSYYDRPDTQVRPFRHLSNFEPVVDTFKLAGLVDVRGEWLGAVDAIENRTMTRLERALHPGRRYLVLGRNARSATADPLRT